MKHFNTYLAGPMEDVADGGVQWRDRITPQLIELFGDRITVQDPTKSEGEKIGLGDESLTVVEAKDKMHGWKSSGHWDKFDVASKTIIEADINAVDRSKFIISFLKFKDKKGNKVQMGGTIGEMQHAYDHNIKIYTICYDNATDMNTWVLGLARNKGNKIFKSFNKALEAIKEDYKDLLLTPEDKKKLEAKKTLKKELEETRKEINKLQQKLSEKEKRLTELENGNKPEDKK
jgi:hypothetical protein